MPYVITRSCCADASCVVACPVNCIHPAPGEPEFGTTEMLYVDPRSCVDCGACVTACPVGAIKPHAGLTEAEQPFLALNSDYFVAEPHDGRTPLAAVPPRRARSHGRTARVAVVGAGPAALFAADELLRHPGVGVDVFDRLPTPYGLARAGVAPDHQDTKQVSDLFGAIEAQPGFRYRLNVEVGRDVSVEELRRHYHAVVCAVGASGDRRLDIEGEELPGSLSATELVGWYNGQPDHADAYVDLGGERVVVVGNGNVALDVARVLTADPAGLAATDVADLPLAALRGSKLREVVVLGRRGPEHAAFTVPELIGLAGHDVDVVVDNGGEPIPEDTAKGRLIAELARRTRGSERPGASRPRIVLRFRSAPVRILGDEHVAGVEVARTELRREGDRVVAAATSETEVLSASMVLRSVGYRGRPLPGLPFDEATGTVPHDRGRVRPGVYVAGWIKRGPTGFIGTNKTCAAETVASLLDDLDAGLLAEPTAGPAELDRLLDARTQVVDREGWRRIDARERALGRRTGRPRVKLVERDPLVAAAQAVPAPARRRRVRMPQRAGRSG